MRCIQCGFWTYLGKRCYACLPGNVTERETRARARKAIADVMAEDTERAERVRSNFQAMFNASQEGSEHGNETQERI